MSTRPDVENRIQAYLNAVEKHLANKPAPARKEVLAGLRDQIMESLSRRNSDPTLEDLERIIGEMDAPECFADDSTSSPSPAMPTTKSARGIDKWFLLGLGFLLLNAFGIQQWLAHTRALPPAIVTDTPAITEAGLSEESANRPPLRLLSVEQINLTAQRELTLRLSFSGAPDRLLIPRFLRLTDEDGKRIEYSVNTMSPSNQVVLTTAPVFTKKIRCDLDQGLPAHGNDLPTEQSYFSDVILVPELDLKRIAVEMRPFADPSVVLSFSSMPDVSSASQFISIKPETKFIVTPSPWYIGSELHLQGAFKAGEIYTVTLSEGMPSGNGSSLAQTIVRRVQIPNRDPALQLDTPGLYLSPQGSLAIPLLSVNLEEWTTSLSPVFPNNLVHLALRENNWYFRGSASTEDLTGNAWVTTNRNTPVFNEEQKHLVHLRDLTTNTLRGAYWLNITGKKANTQQRLIVITDIGMAARAGTGELLVWLNSLSEASPIAGAAVTVYARNNQVIARGTSDERGVAKFTFADSEIPFLVVAESKGDLTYLNLETKYVNQGENISGRLYLKPDQLEAAVFTERGVYRPGETAFMQALVRDRSMNAPAPFPAVFRVRRPDGKIFTDIPVMVSDAGSVSTNVTLPDYLPTGRYNLELAMPGTLTTLGETSVALEDFVPPQIRVELDCDAARATAGTTVYFTVKSEHLFGRAASGLKADGFISIKAAPFKPTGWEDWIFGDEEKAFSTEYRPLGSLTLDEEGRAQFAFETRSAWQPPASIELVAQAAVIEAGGRAVTAYGKFQVDPYPSYIGVKQNWEGTLRTGDRKSFSIAQLSPNAGFLADAKPLVIQLSRVTWNSVLRENREGRYEWQSERQDTLVREDTLSTSGAAAEWSLSVDTAGEYMLVVRDPSTAASTRLFFYAASPEQAWVEWSREKPGQIELKPDRETYHPGETARVMVKAPFRGPALLTIESGRLLEERLVMLEKNTAEVEIPITDGHSPNIYCVLTQIRPAKPESVWRAHRAIGVASLAVQPANRHLNVALDAPAAIRPRERLSTRVTITDDAGNPARGFVTLMAVDEGICLLTDFKTPDPNDYFLSQRALGMQAYDLYNDLMPITGDAIGENTGIGGDMDSGLRRRLNPIKANRFKPVALSKPDVALDTNGAAVIDLEIPEFSGQLRLMAVAYNARQAGAGDTRVHVKRPLVVQPSLPRFLAIGDRSEASVSLFNESEEPIKLTARALCGGPLIAEKTEISLEIQPGQNELIAFPLLAGPGPGKALFRLQIDAGANAFDETIEIPVRPAGGTRIAATSHVVYPGTSVVIKPPADFLPATIDSSGAVSAAPSIQYGRALDYVLAYPYGCLEQTASSALPLLYAEAIDEAAMPSMAAVGSTSNQIANAIQRILSMQLYHGAFALWPYSIQTDEQASMYAIHFLIEARAAGYAVAEENFDSALGWLRWRLDQSSVADADSPEWQTDYNRRAYACHLLALAKKPDAGWNARLREVSSGLSFEAQVHIASALLLSGEPRVAVSLLKSIGLPVERPRDPEEFVGSSVRDAALLMSCWLDIEPANPVVAELGHYIHSRQKDGHWGTTQDNAMALLALGKYAQRVRSPAQKFTAVATYPNGETQVVSSDTGTTWNYGAGEAGTMVISNQGPGILYAWSRMQGVSTEPEKAADHGIKITRNILGIDGKPFDFKNAARGELMIVELSIDTMDRFLDHLVVEDLLPAGWEIENPNLATSQQFSWVTEKQGQSRFRDARDDRMLFFPGGIKGTYSFFYAVRAITPGVYAYPPVTISGMYTPEIRSVSGGETVSVQP